MLNLPELPKLPNKAEEFIEQIQQRFQVFKAICEKNEKIVVTAILSDGSPIVAEYLCWLGNETVFVSGYDSNKTPTDVVMHYSSLQIKIQIIKLQPDEKPKEVKFGFDTPGKKE
ncbi:MAG: hypothetical protein OQJ93_01950 [Ignavibacteriaceae bacterium]|jgi:hypothetical protein|nr:hypothetical protein [Ignavibacteriaceae bacterium]MCW8813486.1 hypothetical protein [Chlorobium sp.]MCW8823784.1 hypothetical protein [Ignavibacteriaceae bacterium]MCW8960055.1 hypothetical protein [Ignavibacteriaceae bacterium]MCW9095379.1 hypothetical protein [Ignavibacteriaceae bacterium]